MDVRGGSSKRMSLCITHTIHCHCGVEEWRSGVEEEEEEENAYLVTLRTALMRLRCSKILSVLVRVCCGMLVWILMSLQPHDTTRHDKI
jgi:phage gp36-like protein